MRFLLEKFLNNPLVIVLMVIIMVISGVYSWLHMPVDLFPDLNIPVVNIICHYPGASPEDIETLISRPVENQIKSIPGVKRVASTSVQGISEVTAQFGWQTTVKDARQLVQTKLARLAGRLPRGVIPHLENIGTTLQEVCGYVIYGGSDMITLGNIARHDLSGRLMEIAGVSSVEVLGGDRRAFYVKIKPGVLLSLNLTIDDVVSILKKNNISAVTGYLDRFGREYLIRGDARLKTIDDIGSVALKNDGGKSILFRDVAKIVKGRAPKHYTIKGNRIPAVAVIIRKQPGASTIRVASGVEHALSRLSGLFPHGTKIEKFYDQSEIIKESQNEIMNDLITGALLAVIVIYFFLGSFKPTLIVALTIPVTFLATTAVMKWAGMSLNVITMTGLSLAIGMIVDDAIVVAENIFRHAGLNVNSGRSVNSGKAVKQAATGQLSGIDEYEAKKQEKFSQSERAAIEGALEIAGADASGTFTTVAAFLPLFMITGIAALFMQPFGFTISAALLISLVLSLTLVPTLFGRIKKPLIIKNDFAGARMLCFLDNLLQRSLKFSFRHKGLVLWFSAALIGTAAVFTIFTMGDASVLPPIDEGAILMEYTMPPGTSLAESNRTGDRIDRIALKDKDVSCVYRRTGSPENGYQIEGVNKGEILVKLKPENVRKRSITEIIKDFKKSCSKLKGTVLLFHQPTQEKIDESFSGLPALFGVTIYGTDMNKLISLAGKVETILLKEPAVSNVVNNTKIKVPEIDVKINNPLLAQYRVNAANILTTLSAARFGVEATKIIRQKEQISVIVKMDLGTCQGPGFCKGIDAFGQLPGEHSLSHDSHRSFNIGTIRNLPIQTMDGKWIPLERVAEITISHAPAAITRLNGQREITLLAEVDGSIPSVVKKLSKKFKSVKLPRGYSIDFTGQYHVIIETFLEMVFAVLAAMVLIYLIMAMQFRSWTQPLFILMTIPLSLACALIGLAVTGQGIDISAGMGTVTLVGIAVNNAIVLIDFANRERFAGKNTNNALLSAASVRLRPILLTSLTTIAALLPAAIGTTVGSNLFQSFAITIISGLAGGIIATLIVIPSVMAKPAIKPGTKMCSELL